MSKPIVSKLLLRGVLPVGLLCFTLPLEAIAIWDNGGPYPDHTSTASANVDPSANAWEAADNFTLAQDTFLTGFDWWGTEAAIPDFSIRI